MASRIIKTMKAAGESEKATCEMVGNVQQCFPANTLVLMEDGSWKAIEHISVGERVMSRNQWNPESPLVGVAVRGLMQSESDELATIRVKSAENREFEIRCTPEHPFWLIGQGWTPADELKYGDQVVGNTDSVSVVSVQTEQETAKVYNLEIEIERTYFVSSISQRGPPCGLWVHNNCVLRQSLEKYVRKEAAALGVTLTDKQVLEGVQILVERAAIRGGRKLLLPLRSISDQSLSRVLAQFEEGVPGMLHVTRSRVVFQGLEVRAVRKFDSLSEANLRAMALDGKGPKFPDGTTFQLHHHRQNALGFIVEIPSHRHSIANVAQHPFGNTPGGGLTSLERREFDNWASRYWRARAKEALLKRGLTP